MTNIEQGMTNVEVRGRRAGGVRPFAIRYSLFAIRDSLFHASGAKWI
jgi:hypothetical protein